MKTGAGSAYDYSIKQFGHQIAANLDVGLGKAMDPAYHPPDETKLGEIQGHAYWTTNVHPMIKRVLKDHGYTDGNMVG